MTERAVTDNPVYLGHSTTDVVRMIQYGTYRRLDYKVSKRRDMQRCRRFLRKFRDYNGAPYK